MGSVGSTSKPSVTFDVDPDEKLQDMPSWKADIREQMEWSLTDVQKSINEIMNDSWIQKDLDHIWEAIHNYYPRSLPGDESEKVVLTDMQNRRIVGIDIQLHDDYNGRITARLRPFQVPFDDWTKKELYDYFSIEEG